MRALALGMALLAAVAAACSAPPRAAQIYDPATVPAGPVGDLVRYGRELIVHTRAHLRPYVVANMECSACHIDGGTKPRGGSLVGRYVQFPQWNQRAGRVITIQDRLAECFLYSMNGKPPAYSSREMVAMTAYIAYLSRGIPMGATPDPATRFTQFRAPHPDPQHGQIIYAQRCEQCHGATGQGSGSSYPPLWGARSFNDGAGMNRLSRMAGFVRYNMPQNAPGTLSDREAADVAAFVLRHGRPHFRRGKIVAFPDQRAGYF